MVYKKGLVDILRVEEPGKCTNCNRDVKAPYELRRSNIVIGRFGNKCIETVGNPIVSANESSKFGLIVPGLSFVDYFARPKVKDMRGFERVQPEADRKTGKILRRNVMDAFLGMKDGQYLHIPEGVEMHPEISNWRKKGYFIRVPLATIEEMNYKGITPKAAAKKHVGKDFFAYGGLMYFNKADNRNRIFSLMALAEGKKIAYLCSQPEIKEKIEIVSDQGPTKVVAVPSTTETGKYHEVILQNLSVESKGKFSRTFEFDYKSGSGDAMYNNMPWSNASMPNGQHYRFQPVRPDKFACAALEYLMSRSTDILVDPRPVVPSNLACKLENRLLQRTVHGSKLLDGQDAEVQLWMAAKNLGYDKMFK